MEIFVDVCKNLHLLLVVEYDSLHITNGPISNLLPAVTPTEATDVLWARSLDDGSSVMVVKI